MTASTQVDVFSIKKVIKGASETDLAWYLHIYA